MVALGVFDGVHLGHIKILKGVVLKASSIKGTSIALSFWPHPQNEQSLYSLQHRLRLIGEQGVDVCIVINFSRHFSRISALDFVRNILLKKIGAAFIYVGKNFRFGKNAEGTYRNLKKLSRKFNFKLKVYEKVKINHRLISSTYIRRLIKKGDLVTAEKFLSRPVSILGTVIKGSFLASRLGVPTANINPHHEVIPPGGIYAVRVIFDGRKFKGVCYIGTRPTIKAARVSTHIEVHIFNFKRNIYGRYLEIQFIRKIRNDRKFPSLAILAKEMKKDISVARRLLSSTN